MFSPQNLSQSLTLSQWRQAISDNYLTAEAPYLKSLAAWLATSPQELEQISAQTLVLLQNWRALDRDESAWGQQLLHSYGLDTREGAVLMSLAEALVRIPDPESARDLIADKLGGSKWNSAAAATPRWLIEATNLGLTLGGRIMQPRESASALQRLVRKLGEPLVHRALNEAVTLLANTFVFAQDLPQGLERAANIDKRQSPTHWHYSFDLLGEAALTPAAAAKYRTNYLNALRQLTTAEHDSPTSRIAARSELSIKLSALHPRYEALREEQLLHTLVGTESEPGYLISLALEARARSLALTVDAEESDRLEISLILIEACLRHPLLRGWSGLGLAVQAYSKRALPVLGYLEQLADELDISLNLRLVKGAYWDSEIHWAQRAGLADYPVFTHKTATDISYLACAKYLLQARRLRPQFATHNAATICALIAMAEGRALEFQRLQGMGEAVYYQVMRDHPKVKCRVYAPIGERRELLPYLVRRLLENGANTSFVNQMYRRDTRLALLARHPLTEALPEQPALALPSGMFNTDSDSRPNSAGLNLAIRQEREQLLTQLHPYWRHQWQAAPLVAGAAMGEPEQSSPCYNPTDARELIGHLRLANRSTAATALDRAGEYQPLWRLTKVAERSQCARRLADLYEQTRPELVALLVREGGKTLGDALDEVREAVDFCRYYAGAAERLFQPQPLPGPSGEHNCLQLEARGLFVCISPWNFPLAIFTGQILAALVAGNCVIAKPARQTCLIAWRATQLMHQAGFPNAAIQLLPGSSADLGELLTSDPRIQGLAFTGSTATGHTINRNLAARASAIASFIAETGGQNAMIADSTCLPEQLVKDVLHSAFSSAGQRCSALRVLYVQEEIADKVIELLAGAMACLRLGDPRDPAVDIGPIIDSQEAGELQAYLDKCASEGRLIAQAPLPAMPDSGAPTGNFIAPSLIQLDSIESLTQEHFGPICHLVRFQLHELDEVIAAINRVGYGLTLGIHSRNQGLAQRIAQQVDVGNVYINRSTIGAVVGVQPFGGCGLSGTGPKAGGPHYLLRFTREKTISNFVAALGGNIELLGAAHSPNTDT